jgi:hypothetical protein
MLPDHQLLSGMSTLKAALMRMYAWESFCVSSSKPACLARRITVMMNSEMGR